MQGGGRKNHLNLTAEVRLSKLMENPGESAMKKFLMAGSALFLAACQPAEAPDANVSEAPDVKLYAMNCGEFDRPDVSMFADDGSFDGQSAHMVVPCWLIRHPSGDLIWDVGLPTSADALAEQLAQLDMTIEDVEYMSVSHSHNDHVGTGGLFAASTWIVDEDERDWMFRDEARESDAFAAYAALEGADTVLIRGNETHDVFGDGSVVIHQAPGHTPGHAILALQLDEAGPVLITGDLWHLPQSRELRTVPVFNYDREQTLASYDYAEALAADTGARVIRHHVPEDFNAMPAFPEALE